MNIEKHRQIIRERVRDEVGCIPRQAPRTIALAYPSPYHVGMSSLGFQTIYRQIQTSEDVACERVFAHDDALDWGVRMPALSYESGRALDEFELIAFSFAYELELPGLLHMLNQSSIPVLREERTDRHPLVIAGGPLTYSNPVPLGPFVDAIVVGEADSLVLDVLRAVFDAPSRQEKLARLAQLPHVVVPAIHGEIMMPLAQCDDALLPAWAPIRTPHTELSNMFLIEGVRGCSRGCRYCVMRRSTNGGMRMVDKEKLLALVPPDAKKVGLVGASVSDHPKMPEIVSRLADRGIEVGLSSLRADRMSEDFMAALKRGGYRTLTTAMDGASERLRDLVERRTTERHLVQVAERTRAVGMQRLKLYLMVGLPTETLEDLEECARLVRELSKVIPVVIGVSPFCAKRNTPLDGAAYRGVALIDDHLEFLRAKLKGRAEVRATSSKWAWVEYVLAQGGWAEGMAAYHAVRAGGKFAAFRKAFEACGHDPGMRRAR